MPIRAPLPSSTKPKEAKSPTKKGVSPRASVSPRAGVSPRAAPSKAKQDDSPREKPPASPRSPVNKAKLEDGSRSPKKVAARSPKATEAAKSPRATEASPSKKPPTTPGTPTRKTALPTKPVTPTGTASSHSRTGAAYPITGVFSKDPVGAPVSIHQRTNGASSHSTRTLQLQSLQSESLLAKSQSPRMARYEPAPAGSASYQPPVLAATDSLDDMVSKMSSKVGNLHDDKYRTIAPAESEVVTACGNSYFRGGPGSTTITESRTRGTIESQLTASTDAPTTNYSMIASGTIMPPAVRHVSEESQSNYALPATYTSGSLEETMGETVGDSVYYSESQHGSTRKSSEQSQSRFNSMSMSSRDSTERFLDPTETFALSADAEDESIMSKQTIAVCCILVSALQLMVLIIQLTLCGVASVDVNPMIGPFPDAFSEWGGKNAYLMLDGKQYWRIITPVLLHVGVLHLLTNVFCQLETCAFFEREWGSSRWITLYLISGIGSVGASCVFDPDVIGVNSSGALMGLMGAKFSQIIGWTMFDLRNYAYYDLARLDQLGGIMCSTALLCILAFFTYIDFSGHMGGLAAGFLGGMFVFCKPIENTCIRVLWGTTGLFGLMAGAAWIGHTLLYDTEPDPDLADACGYFRNLFPEGYDCECLWN